MADKYNRVISIVVTDRTKAAREHTADPVVATVNKALFGGWEGNWMACNTAQDIVLPHSKLEKLGFFMYPVAENAGGRFDSCAPDDFKYQITAKEITA